MALELAPPKPGEREQPIAAVLVKALREIARGRENGSKHTRIECREIARRALIEAGFDRW